MRAVIQRVTSASVTIDDRVTAEIEKGLLVLLGIKETDTPKDAAYIMNKILKLRIFADELKPINADISQVDGEILLVSQFTLYADCSKGNRPSFIQAMSPDKAQPMYELFVAKIKELYPKTKSGVFGADMRVALVNDGPVTIVLDSQTLVAE